MRTANNLEKIENQIMSLPVSEQIHLIERIARRVRSVQTKSGITLNRIQAFTSVLTLSEVLSKPLETGNAELAEKFKTYLKNGPNLTLLPITETIGETAGVLRGKYPHFKTIDAVQIAAALDAEADAFLTNDKKLSGIKEIKILVLNDCLVETRISDRT